MSDRFTYKCLLDGPADISTKEWGFGIARQVGGMTRGKFLSL